MYRFFTLVIVPCLVRADDAPLVTTAKGTIRGVRSEDGNYNMFMGIPYGKVDEANPFGTSNPYPPFDKVFEANDDSSLCPQIGSNRTIVGDIDCLRLNIYTPTYVNTTSRLPVYVYIFGGLFSFGSPSRYMYGPKYLVRHDIILVTINYRLGPYGFMCLDIPEVPGNQGLKDQIMALRWIQSNIIAFGGDPDKVTIGGSSAGSCSVDHHIYRDNNHEKLYNQAILQSGTRFTNFYHKPLKNAPIILARYYQYVTHDLYQAIAFLATLPPRDIIIAETVLGLHLNDLCIEKKFPGVESYATIKWLEQKPATANMSFLIGNTDDELGVYSSSIKLNQVVRYDYILGLYFDTQHEEFQSMSKLVERFYFAGDNFGLDVAKLYSDMIFLYPSYRSMKEFIENNAAAVYMYNFTYVGERSFDTRPENINEIKADHADDLRYLFDRGSLPEKPTATDQLVIDKMTTLWANFVKYGNPTPEMTELIDVKWKPVTPTTPFYCMDINSNLTLTTSSFADKVTFWDLLYKLNSHLIK